MLTYTNSQIRKSLDIPAEVADYSAGAFCRLVAYLATGSGKYLPLEDCNQMTWEEFIAPHNKIQRLLEGFSLNGQLKRNCRHAMLGHIMLEVAHEQHKLTRLNLHLQHIPVLSIARHSAQDEVAGCWSPTGTDVNTLHANGTCKVLTRDFLSAVVE